MKYLIDQSGLVAEGDYLSLSRTMTVKNNLLVDRITGAKHRLSAKASQSIKLLEFNTPYNLWRQYNLGLAMSQSDTIEVIGFLNHIGGLEIKRSRKGRFLILGARLKQLSVGLVPATVAKRWDTDIATIGKAVFIAMMPLIAAVLAIMPLIYGANIEIGIIAIAALGFLFIVWLSTVSHEWSHSKIIARKTTKQILLQKGLRVGILHKSLPTKTEILSAWAGPIIGASISLMFGILIGFVSGYESLLIGIGFIVALMQLVSLVPAYGDGKIIWDNLRRKEYDR